MDKTRSWRGALAVLLTFGAVAAAPAAPSAHVCSGEPCDAVARGFVHFLDRTPGELGGNGRACADCHVPTDSFQLSPTNVQRRWSLLQATRRFHPQADDPLFRAIDADDFRTKGALARDFSTLRSNALVRIAMPLPQNMKLVDPQSIDPQTGLPGGSGPRHLLDPATGQPFTYVDVWRMTPSVRNVALTGEDTSINVWPRGPNVAGGYQLDARVGTLSDQALGALRDHASIPAAPQALLDDLASFQRTLFSSSGVRSLAEALRNAEPAPDPDPPLTAFEQQGKAVFIRACAQCHGGAGGSTPEVAQSPPFPPGLMVGRYHDIHTACPRPVDRITPARYQFEPCPTNVANKVQTYEIHLPRIIDPRTGQRFGGARGEPVYKPQGEEGEWYIYRRSSDPGRALITGFVGGAAPNRDDWQKLDSNGLHGVARTAPYFHNNSAADLRKMVEHYIEFYKKGEADLRDAFGGDPPLAPPELSTDARTFNRIPKPEEIEPLIAYLRKL